MYRLAELKTNKVVFESEDFNKVLKKGQKLGWNKVFIHKTYHELDTTTHIDHFKRDINLG